MQLFPRSFSTPLVVSTIIFLPLIILKTKTTQAATGFSNAENSLFNPVVFIPGDGGSQLEARLNKTERVHYICDLVSNWYDIWLNLHLLAPLFIDCTIDNMILNYDRKTRRSFNQAGVEIRPTNFGSLDSVTYLDIYKIKKTDYFENIAATLEKTNGLTRNVEMVGAPFDFRFAPNELEIFFQNLTELIETTYVINNYRPVTLICHSMGCLNSLYLLNRKTDSWKQVFIRRLVALGAPWHGSFKAISAMMFGDNLGVFLLDRTKLQRLQKTFPSLMYLFPRSPSFPKDRVLVTTPKINYTLENLDDLFTKTGMLDQREMWHDTSAIAANLTAPNVELWCLYGTGIDTPSQIVYDSDIVNSKKYRELSGDGDGTVNVESSLACEEFAKQQEKPVYTRMFENMDHIDILRSNLPAEFIATHILQSDLNEQPEIDNKLV